jgi:hypothetical protein
VGLSSLQRCVAIPSQLIGHVELAPFQLKQGPNPITAQAVIRYTNPVQAGIMRRRAAGYAEALLNQSRRVSFLE